MLWEEDWLSGEDNMCHSIAKLEHHHFKYHEFRNPGDAHVHFLGSATLSFADGVKAQTGDRFDIHHPAFDRPLRNPLGRAAAEDAVRVTAL